MEVDGELKNASPAGDLKQMQQAFQACTDAILDCKDAEEHVASLLQAARRIDDYLSTQLASPVMTPASEAEQLNKNIEHLKSSIAKKQQLIDKYQVKMVTWIATFEQLQADNALVKELVHA